METNPVKAKVIRDIGDLASAIVDFEKAYMEDVNLDELPLDILLDLKNSFSCLLLAETNAALYFKKDGLNGGSRTKGL